MHKVCVIGHPVAHSLSPKLHGYWLKYYGIDAVYEKQDVAPEALSAFIRELPQRYLGCNVTLPHKEAASALMHRLDDAAKKTGAVNLVVVKDGSLIGCNTDAFGFRAALEEKAPQTRRSHAVVLGAGGAARAVVVALKDMGFSNITLINRTEDKAEALARQHSASFAPWAERDARLSDADLLVNTTSLGLLGGEELVLNLDELPSHATVCDIVYTPLITPLLAQAAQRGNIVVDGLGMLLWQAAAAFEAWFGIRPEVTAELRDYMVAP